MSASIRRLYEFNGFRLDAAERLLLREGTPVALAPKAFEMLVVLVTNSGRLLSKDELMQAVWADTVVEENNLDKTISALRKALSENETVNKLIETVRGHGYRFTAPVTEIAAEQNEIALGVAVNGSTQSLHHAADQPATVTSMTVSTPVLSLVSRRQSWRLSLWIKQHKGALLTIALLPLAIATSLRLPLFKGWSEEAPRELKVTRLTNGGDVNSATLSADGKYFVYAEHDGNMGRLWLRQVAGGQPLEIVPEAEQMIMGTTFSPDGQFIYYVRIDRREPQGALYRVPILGGPTAKLLTGIASPVTFSPDGRRLAFVRWTRGGEETHLLIAGSEGDNEQTVLMRSGSEHLGSYGPSWSPDGKEIACQLASVPTKVGDSSWSVIGVNVESGAFKILTAQQWEGCGRIAWLSDRRGLVMIGTRQGESRTTARDQVWYVSQPDGAVRRITTDLNRHYYHCLGVTQDGQSLLVLPYHRTSQIWSVKMNGQVGQARYDARTAAQLTTGTSDGPAGLVSLSLDDGGRVVYVTRTGDHVDLWQMNVDGSQPKQLTTDPPFLEEVTAPPDGRYFVFASNRAGASHLFRVDRDGTNLRQLTQGESNEVDSDCSPDGHWIVYASLPIVPNKIEKYQLWKIPANGGAPIRMTESGALTPRFSPDGKWISYLTYQGDPARYKVMVISADGGAPVKTFDVLDQAVLNVGCRWTPEGQALTYIVTNKSVSNIWAQPLDGGAPYPLTNFNSGMIYNYAFTRDGQHLFLARGYPIRDVLLIKNFR